MDINMLEKLNDISVQILDLKRLSKVVKEVFLYNIDGDGDGHCWHIEPQIIQVFDGLTKLAIDFDKLNMKLYELLRTENQRDSSLRSE